MIDAISDADLVRLARAGDAAGFGVLVYRHEARMLATAYALLGYGPDAQDAVQEAFVVAVSRLATLRDPENVGPWLRGIVRKVCLASLRARSPILVPDLGVDVAAAAADPAELLERQALRDWVWHALEQLTPNLRLVSMLRYFTEANTYTQIAQLCGVPVGTVRSRLSEARRNLAEQLRATAAVAHPDAAARTLRSRREAEESLAAMRAGLVTATFAETWSPSAEVALPDGTLEHGYGRLARFIAANHEDGVRYRLTNVVASSDVSVWETEFLNPPDKPLHCAPAGVWLHFLDAGRTQRFRLLHVPQP
ncbi:RNA polymerase sigma factor [Plantactinospora sp. BB1]|uniref:RNA polymerase sigma factor n=1 Tax=Plantactinospora sp. BB1 TaxID=2071627 RepID=UPI001F3EB110|nr:sigma-70 family RNA polymerase sigma factor [Plantactinospora sp. BB1]